MGQDGGAEEEEASVLRKQLELLSRAVRDYAEASVALPRLFDTIARSMAEAVGGFCAIGVPSRDGTMLEVVASHDDDAQALAILRGVIAAAPIRLDSPHVTTQVFRTGETSFTAQIDDEFLARRFEKEEQRAIVRAMNISSQVLIALRHDGESLGILSLLRHGPARVVLGADERRLAQTMADHASLALANARLFARLDESEARLRRIVDTAHEGIWVTDAERRTTFVNRRLCEMLGAATPDDLVGGSALERIPADERAASDARLVRRRAGIADVLEMRLLRLDGSTLDVAVSSSSMMDDGRYSGAVSLITDITEKKRIEEQLRESQRMDAIGRLAGGVAHDFNNLLSIILSVSDLAAADHAGNTAIINDLNEIRHAGERARDLTRQILAFSRKQILAPRVMDVNASITALRTMIARLIGENIELRLFLGEDVKPIFADPSQIDQVLVNLMVNARDAMPNGGRISVETGLVVLDEEYARTHVETRPGPHVMIAVTDTGHGMDKVTQSRIFEPFFTTKGIGHGTGLGLATVFGIVKQSGGSIWLYSEVGRGTTFKVYFPVAANAAARASPSTPPPAPARAKPGTRVLLVEDDASVRGLVCTILERAGYTVLVAEEPKAAIALCAADAGAIDLLLTDVVMPEMTGKALADLLTAARPSLKTLFMSGYTDNTIVHHGVLDAGVAFLPKPITPDALLRKVAERLAE